MRPERTRNKKLGGHRYQLFPGSRNRLFHPTRHVSDRTPRPRAVDAACDRHEAVQVQLHRMEDEAKELPMRRSEGSDMDRSTLF